MGRYLFYTALSGRKSCLQRETHGDKKRRDYFLVNRCHMASDVLSVPHDLLPRQMNLIFHGDDKPIQDGYQWGSLPHPPGSAGSRRIRRRYMPTCSTGCDLLSPLLVAETTNINTRLHCGPGDLGTEWSGRVSHLEADEKGGGSQIVAGVDDLLQFVGRHGERE